MASSGSTSYSIRGHSVVFHEESHEYFVDGVKVPSVTEILGRYSRLHGLDDYADIPQDVLRRAAARGTALHKEIEEYEKQGVRGFSEEFGNYLPLKIRHGVKVVASELPVLIFGDSGKPVCAGRLDLLATINGDAALGDIKRTSRLYPKKVSLQLNLYRIGCIQSYGKACDRLFVMRLRKASASSGSFRLTRMLPGMSSELLVRSFRGAAEFRKKPGLQECLSRLRPGSRRLLPPVMLTLLPGRM